MKEKKLDKIFGFGEIKLIKKFCIQGLVKQVDTMMNECDLNSQF